MLSGKTREIISLKEVLVHVISFPFELFLFFDFE